MVALNITKVDTPQNKYDKKCPYEMPAPIGITIHNTANKASAMSEVSYMLRNNNSVSFHFAVDYERAVQGIPLDRNTWHCGDGSRGTGNRNTISIEICHSTNPDESLFEKSEDNAAKLTAILCVDYGWGINKICKHQDWNGKYCPHKTLDMGWYRFLNLVQKYIDELKSVELGSTELVTGMELNLTDVNGYSTAGTDTVDSAKSGIFYLWSDEVINGRVKITNAPERVGVVGQVSCWVNVSDIVTVKEVEEEVIEASSEVACETEEIAEAKRCIAIGQECSIDFTGFYITVDGVVGSETREQAVRVLQTALNKDYDAGLKVDGILGDKTLAALANHYVKLGESQYMVTALEILLYLNGYNPNGVEYPGRFGNGLYKASKQFQRDNNLIDDGIVGRIGFKELVACK